MSTVTERVTTAVETLAVRLADPVRCRAVATDPGNTDPFREMTPWEPMGLAHGYPGAALFWAELAREDPAAGRVANGFLREAMNSGDRASNGLYYGPASLLAAVQTLVTADGRERRMHAELVRLVAHNQIARADAWLTRLQTGGGVAWGAYDVINGLGGVGRLLLDEQGTDEVDRALRKTMEVFLTLAADTDVEGHRVPGWWVSAAGQPIPSDAEQYPRGDFNLGMAHGAAGILAFLAASVLAGAGGAEVEEALARTRTHLLGAAVRDEAGPYWPARLSFDAWVDGAEVPLDETRSAWCYGTPGVAAAILQSTFAVPDPEAAGTAIEGLRAMAERPQSTWGVDGATVCHGLAGVLAVVTTAKACGADVDVLEEIALEGILKAVDGDLPFGVRHQVRIGLPDEAGVVPYAGLDAVGTLEGAAGVGCVLWDWLRGAPAERSWARTVALQ